VQGHAPYGDKEERPQAFMAKIHEIFERLATEGSSCLSWKAYARQIHNVLITQRPRKNPRLNDLQIIFIEECHNPIFTHGIFSGAGTQGGATRTQPA
jgi:hypothetical protein